MTTLYVLSKSEVKINAVVESGFCSIFGKIEYVDKSMYEDAEKVIEQPFNNGGQKVCRGRILTFLEKQKLTEMDWVLSIENYILHENSEAFDVCHVELYNDDHYEYVDGPRAKFPYSFYEKLIQEKSIMSGNEVIGYARTVGNIVKQVKEQEGINVSDKDWINLFNEFDRKDQIVATLCRINFKNYLHRQTKTYHDFPKKGIEFDHVIELFSNSMHVGMIKWAFRNYFREINSTNTVFVGLEARGFPIASFFSCIFNCPFIMIRKKDKLPGEVYTESYGKEYGKDVFEIQKNAINPGSNVIIVDDVVATGGSLVGAHTIVQKFCPTSVRFFVMAQIDLCLDDRKKTMGKLEEALNIFFF